MLIKLIAVFYLHHVVKPKVNVHEEYQHSKHKVLVDPNVICGSVNDIKSMVYGCHCHEAIHTKVVDYLPSLFPLKEFWNTAFFSALYVY
jgi:hypothetical protein